MFILYNQRDATYIMFFIIVNALHVLGRHSTHHQEPIKLYVQPWLLSCLPAVYCWCGWVVPTHPHQRYTQGCTCSFIGSWWWAEGLPETCTALIIIKKIT